MNRILQFLIFFSIFFIIYFGMHFYVFSRIGTMLSIKKNILFYVVMALLALSFPAASMIERIHATAASRLFYMAAGAWLGALFLAFSALLVYEVVNLLVKLDKRAAAITILIVVLALVIYGVINFTTIKVREVEIQMPNLPEELTVVQLADMHIGTVHEWEYMGKIVEITNKANPDMVLITGDLYDGSRKIDERIVEHLNNIKAKTFFTTGNHEIFQGVDEVMKVLNKTKIQPLRNEMVEYKGVQIIGIDNPTRELSQKNDIISTIKIDKTKPSILMFHPPTGLEQASQAGINLQLSGHTHHGQIMPFTLISKLVYKRNKGLFKYNDTYLYVTEGAGTWGPPMRVGTRNEVTVIKLVKK
ncbi:MAG: metallophosphoesterase [Candidatus Nanoarchaeia archaeon]